MSDTEYIKRASCTAKKQYASAKKANIAIQQLRKHKDERGLHVYVCQFCHYFHVGHVLSKERLLAEANKKRRRHVQTKVQ